MLTTLMGKEKANVDLILCGYVFTMTCTSKTLSQDTQQQNTQYRLGVL